MLTAKRVVTWVVIAFLIYTVVTNPEKAADLARSAFNGIASAGGAIGRFFSALVSG